MEAGECENVRCPASAEGVGDMGGDAAAVPNDQCSDDRIGVRVHEPDAVDQPAGGGSCPCAYLHEPVDISACGGGCFSPYDAEDPACGKACPYGRKAVCEWGGSIAGICDEPG